jgi:hypothetical protein
MQSANLSAGDPAPEPVPLLASYEAPQAASATAQVIAVTLLERLRLPGARILRGVVRPAG